MFTAIAAWSVRNPWKAIGAWLLAVVAATALGGMITPQKTSDQDYYVGESARAAQMQRDAGLAAHHAENALVTGADPQARVAAATDLVARWKARAEVGAVGDPLPSPDGQALLVHVELKDKVSDAPPSVDPLKADVAATASAHPSVRLQQTGTASTTQAINAMAMEDMTRAETTSLPVTLLLMLLVFGALIAAGLPVVVGISSVAIASGLAVPLSHLVPMEDSAASMVVLIGMAVGVDYSLFYLRREREEKARGASTPDAVRIAARTSGHSILVSGAAVVVALAGLFLMDFAAFSSLAASAIVVVAVACVGSLTVLPALLSKLGRWVDRPRVPGLGGHLARVERARRRGLPVPVEKPSLAGRLVAPVVAHPWAALTLGLVVVGALSLPALAMRTAPGSVDSLPASIPEVAAVKDLQARYPSEGTQAAVVVRTGPSTPAELKTVTEQASRHGWAPAGQPQVSADRSVTVLPLATKADAGSQQLLGQVAALRSATDSTVTTEHAVGGEAGMATDIVHRLDTRMPWTILTVLGLTALMMVAAFRSPLIGLVTSVLNLASVGVAFGVLTAVFQTGIGTRMLGVPLTGSVRDWVPMFLFSILVGLSMDYHVFVLSRIREGIASGMPVRTAITDGIARTAGVVTSAAVVMVSVFAIFASLGLAEMKQIGVGLAVAIAVDATLVRLVLLPAMLAVLGRAAWPRRVLTRADAGAAPQTPAKTAETASTSEEDSRTVEAAALAAT